MFLGMLFRSALARVLKKNPSESMGLIYNFTSPPREARRLEFLSGEFWQVLDQCCEANAASEILETELHDLELERRERIHKLSDDYLRSLPMDQILERVDRGPQDDTAKADVQPIVLPEFTLKDLLEATRPGMRREKELKGLIEKARGVCSTHETKLNTIAWDLMVEHGLIPASVVARVS